MRVRVPNSLWSLGVYCAAAVVLYLPVLRVPFLSDDLTILYRIGVQGDLGVGSFFRPLGDLTHALNYWLTGPRPWAFRLVNLLLLGLAAWQVHRLAQKMGQGLEPAVAKRWGLFSGVLFLFHPFHLEPHIWIVGRGVAMATVAVLFALLAAIAGDRGWRVAAWTFLGGLCYESAFLVPLLVAVQGHIAQPNDRARTMRVTGAALVASLTLLALRLVVHGKLTNTYGEAFLHRPPMHYAEQTAVALARLVMPPVAEGTPLWAAGSALVTGVALVMVIWWRNNQMQPMRHLLITTMALVLGASLLGALAGVSLRTSEGDRFLHLASAFACMAIGLVMASLGSKPWRRATLTLLVAISALALWHGQQHWREAGSLLERVVRAVPEGDGQRMMLRELPGDHRGAYVLRHGLREALYFAGRDTAGIVPYHDGTVLSGNERTLWWNGERFVE
ncbi:MAG: hypothetical protein R2817_11970 [Flavobacteriales bacterium]